MRTVERKFRVFAWLLLATLWAPLAAAQRAGDLDANGRIDFRDALLLSFYWYAPAGDFPGADLAGPGGTTEPDLLAFRATFGQVYQPTQTYHIRDYVVLNLGDEWHWINYGVGGESVNEIALPGPFIRDRNNVNRTTVKLQSDYMGLERFLGYRGNTLALFRISVTPDAYPVSFQDVDIKPEVDWGNDAIHVGDRFHTSSTAVVTLPSVPGSPPQPQTVYLEVDVTYVAAGEPVEVAAGRFLDTLKAEIHATAEAQGQTADLTPLSGMVWYARGVGEVKRMDTDGNLMELQSAFINGVTIP